MLELLLVLLGLAFPVMAVFALVTALGARTRLNLLQARIMALESGAPAASPVPAPAVAPAPPAPAAPAAIATSKKAETPPASAPPGTPPSPPPKQETIGFEQRFGTQWVVWVGGLALALGGIFLVRYSIEQGLIGPGVRIMLAALLALALIAAGEWARRKEIATGIAGIPRQHIPSILTAAGTVVAYATVYGAFALYGFLPAAAAFVLLGVVALATLAAALLHGPALAGLGLVGAFVTPLLIATKEPNYWALYLYLAVVTAAAFALARLRMWKWLAITAAVIAALWALAGLGGAIDGLAARLFHVVAGYALAAALIVAGVLYGPPAAAGEIDRVSSGVLGAYLIAAALLAIAGIDDLPALTVFALLCAATVGIAWRSDAAVAVVPAAAVLAAVVMLHWMAGPIFNGNILPAGPVAGAIPEPARAAVGLHLAFGAFYAVLFGLSGFFAQGRSEKPLAPILWAAAAAFAPLAILIALYYRVAEFERSIPFAALALLLAALYAVAAETLVKRPPRPGLAAGRRSLPPAPSRPSR